MRLWEITEPATRLVVMGGQQTADLVWNHKINRDIAKRLKYFNDYHNETNFIILQGEKIVAAGGLQENPHDKSNWWMKHVSVDSQYQGQGFARQIMEAMFKFALEKKIKLSPSSFTKMGQERILHIYNQLRDKYPHATMDGKDGDPRMFEGRLDELLDQPADWSWKRQDSKSWEAKFEINNIFYWVYLDGHDQDIVGLTFTGDGLENLTGSGNSFKVFSTVIAIVRDFLTHRHPESLYFSAKEPSRRVLYKRLANLAANELRGRLITISDEGSQGYQIILSESQINEDGKIIPGVNTTCDVSPGETQRQAEKFGNTLDSQGRPPLLSGSYGDQSARYSANQGDPFYGQDGTNIKAARK